MIVRIPRNSQNVVPVLGKVVGAERPSPNEEFKQSSSTLPLGKHAYVFDKTINPVTDPVTGITALAGDVREKTPTELEKESRAELNAIKSAQLCGLIRELILESQNFLELKQKVEAI